MISNPRPARHATTHTGSSRANMNKYLFAGMRRHGLEPINRKIWAQSGKGKAWTGKWRHDLVRERIGPENRDTVRNIKFQVRQNHGMERNETTWSRKENTGTENTRNGPTRSGASLLFVGNRRQRADKHMLKIIVRDRHNSRATSDDTQNPYSTDPFGANTNKSYLWEIGRTEQTNIF